MSIKGTLLSCIIFLAFNLTGMGCAENVAEDNMLLLLTQVLTAGDVLIITESDNSTIITESGGSDTITYKLKSQPTADVTVSLLNDDESSLDVSSMTFTSSDWNTAQTLTVTAVDDSDQENTHTGIINYTTNSSDSNFSNKTGSLTISITDNDYPCAGKYTFITQTTYTGNLGGFAGADAKCNSDVNKPSSGTYKALLVGATRIASTTANAGDGQADWVLSASTAYYNPTCTSIVFTSDANAIFLFGTLTTSLATLSTTYWTGLNTDWTTPNTGTSSSGRCCGSWTSASSTPRGYTGSSTSTSNTSINNGNQRCNQSRSIVCIEQ